MSNADLWRPWSGLVESLRSAKYQGLSVDMRKDIECAALAIETLCDGQTELIREEFRYAKELHALKQRLEAIPMEAITALAKALKDAKWNAVSEDLRKEARDAAGYLDIMISLAAAAGLEEANE